jgi:glycosyltransferase involved in cell wall biosynthesis
VLILIWVEKDHSKWTEAVASIRAALPLSKVIIASPQRYLLDQVQVGGVERVLAQSFTSFVNATWPGITEPILIVWEPVLLPLQFALNAQTWMHNDARISGVSFLSSHRGFHCEELRLRALQHAKSPLNPQTIQDRLRADRCFSDPVVAPGFAGSLVLVNARLLELTNGLDSSLVQAPWLSLWDFAFKCAARGFVNVVDLSSYVEQLDRAQADQTQEACLEPLRARHPQFLSAYTSEGQSSPLRAALDQIASRVYGIRVLIDGTCLGPMEMGTQVQTLFLVAALARHPEIERVSVALPAGGCPDYAQLVLAHPKIHCLVSHNSQFEGAELADIVHRPYQPDAPIPWSRWRTLGKRVIITLQDLIAYRNGSYFESGDTWLSYRANMRASAASADAIVTISEDVATVIRQEALRIHSDRLFVVPNGTDHIPTELETRVPSALLDSSWAAAPFALVLGANYSHKNRDIAIRVWSKLTDKHPQLRLVLCGPKVPKGSSDELEIQAGISDSRVRVLLDVPNAEKNWLLKHAALVLYSTSAEGFGFVPYEAARVGTPTLYTSFGPFAELIAETEAPKHWDIVALSHRADQLLSSSDVMQHSIHTILQAADQLTWDRVAEGLVLCYKSTLGVATSNTIH